jgi:glycosyltransferase
MRVAFTLWPAPAHLYPFVPLAWALRSAGHEVVFLSHPSLGPVVTASGLPFAPMCEADQMPEPAGPTAGYPEARKEVARITEALNVPVQDEVAWGTVSQAFLPSMWDFSPFQGDPTEPMPAMDGLVSFFRAWRPDLVIWDPCMPGAAVAARAVGAAQCRQSGTDYNGWFLDTFTKLASKADDPGLPNPFVETIRAMAERYDVPIDHETLYGQWTIDHVPSGMNFEVNTRRVPLRWIPHTAQTAMPSWLYPVPDRPRVALSLGLSVRKYVPGSDWSYVRTLLDALGGLDVEVVATLDDAQLSRIGTIPDNVRTIDYLPLDNLMPTCQLLVHHGGIGTMAAAGCVGVPQIVVDFLHVQHEDPNATGGQKQISFPRYKLAPVTGAYVTSFGAGEVLDLSRPSVEKVREMVTAVLTDSTYQDGADRLRADLMAAPSPAELVPELEKLAMTR